MITIHNHPDHISFPKFIKQHKYELPDIESADIYSLFDSVFNIIQESKQNKKSY